MLGIDPPVQSGATGDGPAGQGAGARVPPAEHSPCAIPPDLQGRWPLTLISERSLDFGGS